MPRDRRGEDHRVRPDRHRVFRHGRVPEVQRRRDGRLHPHRRRTRKELRRPAENGLIPAYVWAGAFIIRFCLKRLRNKTKNNARGKHRLFAGVPYSSYLKKSYCGPAFRIPTFQTAPNNSLSARPAVKKSGCRVKTRLPRLANASPQRCGLIVFFIIFHSFCRSFCYLVSISRCFAIPNAIFINPVFSCSSFLSFICYFFVVLTYYFFYNIIRYFSCHCNTTQLIHLCIKI